MIENLKLLYFEYGGIKTVLRSGYFRCAMLATLLALFGGVDAEWSSITIAVMPSITGFTIAAFALIFAVLGPEQIKLLAPRAKDGKSPLLGIASAIAHAVIVQASSLILASLYGLSNFDSMRKYDLNCLNINIIVDFISKIISSIGIFITFYGIFLVMASVLFVFRMAMIIWK